MSFISLLRYLAFSFYDYRADPVNHDNIALAVIHVPDQIGDAMSVFPVIRSLEVHKVKHLIIVASDMNTPVFEALTLTHTKLTLITTRFQDDARLTDIKAVARRIRIKYGVPDLCIEAMRKKNLKTMCFISHLRAKTNFQAVGLNMRCYSPCCKMASKMDQIYRAPVPVTWAILMREAGFPPVRPAFEFPLSNETLAEVRRETRAFDYYIAFNFEGSVQQRTFSLSVIQQLIALIKNETDLPILVVHGPKGTDDAVKLTQCYDNVFRLSLPPSITRSAAIIKDACLVITPDTSILHIASAYNIPVIAVYANYKTRWPAMQDISETIVVGGDIDNINLDEFKKSLLRLLLRIDDDTTGKCRIRYPLCSQSHNWRSRGVGD